MFTKNSYSTILWWAFGGLIIFILLIISLFVVLIEEILGESWVLPRLVQSYLPTRAALHKSIGDEFTGEATALLFVMSSIPVVMDLIFRSMIRYLPSWEKIKGLIRRINNKQRKYLMPLHTYLSILALGFGILHLSLSSCIANPFPEWGLILSGVLVVSGLLFKWKAFPSKIRIPLYKFHTSLLVTGVLSAILLVGHSIMSLD